MSEPTRPDRLAVLLRDALDLEGAEREAFLIQHCAGESALRNEVEALLARVDAGSGALDEPALAWAGRLLEADAPTRLGEQIGAFRVTGLLGEGGMGTVYRAVRVGADFSQTVALKIIRGSAPSASLRERFRRERAILASLDHPSIARFIDGGVTEQGELWFAMTLIEGASITQYAKEHALDVAARVRLLAGVCDAVAAAHRSLVVHRDIKPGNILVDASGAPHLLDFGIAKLLENADSELTRTDACAHTPHYAAPEQIRGEVVTTAADVYALGVVLFELLTGRRPFALATSTAFNVQRAVLEAQRPTLAVAASGGAAAHGSRAWAKQLEGDLEHIVERAMARDPSRRYASASALAEDLRLHLAGKPIHARPDSASYRVSKFVQRHRVAVALAAFAIVALLSTTAAAIKQATRAQQATQRANEAADLARLERDAARDEGQRQDALREHFVAVLNRAAQSPGPISASQLTELAADRGLLGAFKDPEMQRALDLAIIDFFTTQGDYPRVMTLLDALEPRMQNAPGRYRAMAAANRANAAIRIGKLDDAQAAIASAERAMSLEQRRGGALEARLETLRGQLLRARGDLVPAAAAANRAVNLAVAARDISELDRGATVAGAAVAMLQLGDLERAAEFAAKADDIWRVAGVTANVSMRNAATVRTNALFLRGELLEAVAGMEAINSDNRSTESPASRAARDSTQAKALALLARPEQALALLKRAVEGMCEAVGAQSLDCLHVRLSAISTLYLAGQAEQARRELNAIRPALSSQPPLIASGNSSAAILDLLLEPSDAALSQVLNILLNAAKAGALPRRNAVRALLVVAEILHERGNATYAERLAQAALDSAGDAIIGGGMDASLLTLWRARIGDQPVPADALRALSSAMGPEHPWVRAHRQPE